MKKDLLQPDGRPLPREVVGLAAVFGAMYFVQGIAEPTEGLISQPVRSLLKSWQTPDADISSFMAWLALPWTLKPIYGLLTDFLPIAGYRRKSYLVLTTLATTAGLGILFWFPPTAQAIFGPMFLMLFVATTGVAFSDVVIDALMVEKGQPRGLTGQLQSVQWTAIYAATIGTGFVGGYLSQIRRQELGFLICAAATGLSLLLILLFIREPKRSGAPHSFDEALGTLARAARTPGVWAVGSFLLLWNFNPFSSTVLYLFMTKEMGFSEQFYGNTVSLSAVASVVAASVYGLYCRRAPFPWLVHGSIVLGILSTVAYWGLRDTQTALVITVAVGLTYMTATMVQLDLAARIAPPEIAGTVFALLMALSNLGIILSTYVGGQLYDRFGDLWGKRVAFDCLVGIGATFTAGCWLLVPILRHASAKALEDGAINPSDDPTPEI